jgi:hypothetical protein
MEDLPPVRWYESGSDFAYKLLKKGSIGKDFYKNPTIEIFNDVLGDDPAIDDSDDNEEELFIEYENENRKDIYKRREKILNRKKIENRKRMKWSDCHLLAWIYAACKAFPHLIIDCKYPLLIERSQQFYNKCIPEITRVVLKGNGLVNYCCNYKLTLECRYNCALDNFVSLHKVMFTASGNITYLDTIREHSDIFLANDVEI